MQEEGFKKKKRGEGIVHLSSLFDIYKKRLKAPQGSVIEAFITSVEEEVGVTLLKSQCVYKVHSKTLLIHAPGPIKTELLLQKENILNNLSAKLGEQNAPKNII